MSHASSILQASTDIAALVPETLAEKTEPRSKEYFIFALALVLLIGTIVSAWLLHGRLGHYTYALAAGGTLLSVIPLGFLYLCKKNSAQTSNAL